ncbi:metalloendoproteinase 1-like [Vigna radiata var. radiata]|uniref:Metalloendoproteinase 1-like n=1 Tax=Vigna radiata var. radiata TaxID=3916 RepID=A0A1S3VUP8_VIGRR|nr:metalloendoproteinase 1-like [Vigna radiata var. radiata]
MKPNLSAFLLLFLLLLHQALLANAVPPVYKIRQIGQIGYKWGKRTAKTVFDYIHQHNFSSPQQNQTLQKIEGLSRIKEYFYNFGYLQFSETFDDFLDQPTVSAIQTYQQSFNLTVTGKLNNETLQLISLPRCAVPDRNFDYGFTENVSWPKAGNQWSQKKNLTYGFLPESDIPDNAMKVFGQAFTRWANATGLLNLTQTKYDDADIKVGFYVLDDIYDFDVDVFGISFIREESPLSVKTAEIRLNANRSWALPSENNSLSWEDDVLDLESVAMHEIGHLLGLDHSFLNDSVMYPYILPSQQRKIQLSNSDKTKILQQNIESNSGYCGSWRVLVITTLSLGFSYMVLLA